MQYLYKVFKEEAASLVIGQGYIFFHSIL